MLCVRVTLAYLNTDGSKSVLFGLKGATNSESGTTDYL